MPCCLIMELFGVALRVGLSRQGCIATCTVCRKLYYSEISAEQCKRKARMNHGGAQEGKESLPRKALYSLKRQDGSDS